MSDNRAGTQELQALCPVISWTNYSLSQAIIAEGKKNQISNHSAKFCSKFFICLKKRLNAIGEVRDGNTGRKEINIWHNQFYRFCIKQNDFEIELTATFFLVWSAPKSQFFVHVSNNVMSIPYYIKTARTSFSRGECQSFTPEKHVLTFKTTTSLVHLKTEVSLWLLNYCGTDGLRHLVKSLMGE